MMRCPRLTDVNTYLRRIVQSVHGAAKQAAVSARSSSQKRYAVGRYLVIVARDDVAVTSRLEKPVIAVMPVLAVHHGREVVVAALIHGSIAVKRGVSDRVAVAFTRSLRNYSSATLSTRLAEATRAAELAYVTHGASRVVVATAGLAVTPIGVEWSVAGGASISIRRGEMQSRLTRADGASERSATAMPLQSGDELLVCGRDDTPRLRFSIAERSARELGHVVPE